MYHIRNNAESSVRNLLRDVVRKLGTNVLSAVDYLDDGSPACLSFLFGDRDSNSLNGIDLSSSRDKRDRRLRRIRLRGHRM